MIIILTIFSYLDFVSTSQTCNPMKKIQYGDKADTEGNCLKYGGCWDENFKCYFSQEYIPGFRMFRGECKTCPASETFTNLNRRECARECLKKSTCNCFTYDSSTKECQIKNSVCQPASFENGAKLTYDKHASDIVVCGHGSCSSSISAQSLHTIEGCIETCAESDDDCEFIELVTSSTSCLLKRNFCHFTLPENANKAKVACLPGPIFSDWFKNHDIDRENIEDDSNSTCMNVSSSDNFNMKIPWPSVGEVNPNFNISVIGKNLEKCIDLSKVLIPNGIAVYVVYESLPNIQFTGNFKACELIGGNDSTECRYTCSCGLDYCESAHVRAFASGDIVLSICHYQILK